MCVASLVGSQRVQMEEEEKALGFSGAKCSDAGWGKPGVPWDS